MALHALDAIDDALTATRRYRPRGLFEWLWVAVVAGTVASPGIGLPTGGGSGGGMTPEQRAGMREGLPATVPDGLPAVAAAVAATAVALWVLFLVVGAFLEFPFLRWLRDGELAVRAEAREHWRGAAGLAAFRLAVNLLSLAALAGAAVALAGTAADPLEYLLVLGEYWVVFALVGLATGVLAAFTTAFVVPAMWLEDRGVLGGWRRVWPTLAGAPKQFLAYAVGVAVLAYVGGILVLIAAVVAFVPVGILALALAATVGSTAAIGVAALLGGALMTVAVAVVYALLQTFLRYYALFVLGDVDPDLDAIPERRRAVRAGATENGGDGDDDGNGDGDGAAAAG